MTIWFICAISYPKEENRKNYIRGMLRTLTKREENVLRMYFGIDRERRLTLEEIGRDYDRKVDYVKRVKNKGIRKIKHPTRSSILTSHIDKDLMERSIKERGKLLDEFLVNLLYPPKRYCRKMGINVELPE